jgi:N-succinyldiaminopimelate aminotransferase
MRFSPGVRDAEPYPFEALDRARARARAQGRRLLDFGVGDPREDTPAFIRRALAEAIGPVSSYPRAAGLPELRRAVADWCEGRFGVRLDESAGVLPTLGSKEIIFSLASVVLDPDAGKDLVAVTTPGYTIPERGARYAGGKVLRMPIRRETGFLPDLDAIDPATWRRVALAWTNYPNNPTGAVAPLSFYARLAELAREHGFLLASDEAYSELYFGDEPPVSVLQLADHANVLAVNTLSKRSSMTGYRSGFVAGDPQVLDVLRKLRPSVGVTPQEFVQRAAAVAWSDEEHVRENRARYAAKRAVFLALFERLGVEVAASEAGLYLWVVVAGGEPSEEFAERLLEGGVVVAPGSYFGPDGQGYVRMAMVPPLEECELAAEILVDLVGRVRA